MSGAGSTLICITRRRSSSERGEHLYALVEFTTHSAALCVDDPKEFHEFSKLLCPYEFYALSEYFHSRSV